jgi:hypothetical protein
LFKFYFEPGEISIRKVAPYLKIFLSIFYLEFLEPISPPFDVISNATLPGLARRVFDAELNFISTDEPTSFCEAE